MADIFTKKKRSEIMSRIKGKNTKPELIIRRALFREGYRYRLHRKNLPGNPDIVIPNYALVIFIHGCFWHQHEGCKRNFTPKSNKEYWIPKLQGNVGRFKKQRRELNRYGWHAYVIWECEVKKEIEIMSKIENIINRVK